MPSKEGCGKEVEIFEGHSVTQKTPNRKVGMA